MAVEANAVNADGARRLSARLAGIDNGHILGSTALGVLDGCSAGVAGGALLAGGSVRHAIVEFQGAVELDRDLELVDGEGRDIGTAGEAGATGWFRVCLAGDAFILSPVSCGTGEGGFHGGDIPGSCGQ